MGNRAVISVKGSNTGIYLHWNGGPESVSAFLRAAKDLGVRAPESDPSYFTARLAQIIGNFMGGTLSLGVESLSKLDTDNGDNGHYIVGGDYEVVARKHTKDCCADRRSKKERDEYSSRVYDQTMDANRAIFKRSE